MKFNLKNKKVLVSIIVISSLSVGAIMLKPKDTPQPEIADTSIVEMFSVSGEEKVFINGRISPKQTKTFFKDSTLGEIEKVNVNSGEMVDKGYLLYTYKNTYKEEELKEKEAELKLKETELQALKKNPQDNAIDIKVLEKEISNLRNAVSKVKSEVITKVTAPFDGIVYLEDEIGGEEGQVSFLTIDSRDYYIEGVVNERDLPKVSTGMKADIHVFSSNEDKTGKLAYISKRPLGSTTGDMSSSLSQYKVRVEFDNQENLVNGFHAQVKLTSTDRKIEIPTSAIFIENEKQYVLINENGIAKKKEVKAEIVENDTIATIISGLSNDDLIVKDVESSNLKDGDEINPDTNIEGGEIVDSVQF